MNATKTKPKNVSLSNLFTVKDKKNIIHCTLVVLLGLVTMLIVLSGSKSYAVTLCRQNGGEIYNMNDGFFCARVYADGGNECKTSMECEGRCYVHAEGQKPTCETESYPGKCRGDLDSPPRCE